jgi:hypothetical protein
MAILLENPATLAAGYASSSHKRFKFELVRPV